jgi:transposase
VGQADLHLGDRALQVYGQHGSPRSGNDLSGDPERATSPERPKCRTFVAKYKLRILQETDEVLASGEEGGVGEVLRREGLYLSHLTKWRRERDEGQLAGLTPKKRGRKPQHNPLAAEYARLRREHEKVKHELFKANAVIEVQRKVAALLGACRAGGARPACAAPRA